MLNFCRLEAAVAEHARAFRTAEPYEHIVIDNFCDEEKLTLLVNEFPDPVEHHLNKSRDYVFAKNKYEKSAFSEISPRFQELFDDFLSARFQSWLQAVTGEPVFVDPSFHGGGIHQGGAGSFLDMHVDFNTHPLHKDWFRNLNVLLYLNKDWRPEYCGELKLRHKDRPEHTVTVQPLFNRCVVMFTRDYTVHGYDPIAFPEGTYRRSMAVYAYSPLVGSNASEHRSTVWYPDGSNAAKSLLGRLWPTLVRIKGAVLGSSTAKNK
jgi:hypothetical protein